MNAFSSRLASELDAALKALEADGAVRVVIVKGSGKGFCAGIDLSEFQGKDESAYRSWTELMERPFLTIAGMGKPVIAQVHGIAAANGAGLVAAADLAVAADTARLGLTAINVGLNCVGPVVPVARSIGRKRALDMLLTGRLFSAAEALGLGLVSRVVPEADLERETRELAASMALKSPVAMRVAKKAFYAAEDMDYRAAFEYMNEAFSLLCSTKDAAEGVGAFLGKRRPEWTGE